MSLYQQNQFYTQPYPAPGFSHPLVHGGYQYQQPPAPPAPAYPIDPSSFRRLYTAKLSELTVNSRPIIQNLSMLAQDLAQYSQIVAECLETHIRRALPWAKLPAFYLLDAISKNVFEPYARVFSTFVVPLFLDTHNEVDPQTRSKMEEMLLTWRTGAPGGRELFGKIPQAAIEQGVWNTSSSSSLQPAQVLTELEFTLNQKERALQTNPYDKSLQNHVNVLYQLRKLVENGVSPKELQQIVDQLRVFSQSTAPPPPVAPASLPSVIAPPAAPIPQYPIYPNIPAPSQIPSSCVQPAPQPITKQTYGFVLEQRLPIFTEPTLGPSSSSTPATVGDIAVLVNALKKAGYGSSNNTPTGAGATLKEETPKPEVDEGRDSSRAYRSVILSQDVKLTSADIAKRKPSVVTLLYKALPIQCKQCGVRFADTTVGKKKMEDHLDMHFRQNRKANQNAGRGHSRSWFVTTEDWINDTSEDVKGKGRADGTKPKNARAAATAEVAKREADLRTRFVVVPPGDGAKELSCPICKEILHPEFLEDDEEWVWRNAVLRDDKVYHATCYAEATSTTNLAARLRNEAVSRSRSGTPEVKSARLTPPKLLKHGMRNSLSPSPSPQSKLAGTKRKAEPESSLNRSEADRTPPYKKLALTV